MQNGSNPNQQNKEANAKNAQGLAPPPYNQYPPQNGQYGQYPPQNGQYGQYPPQNGQYPPQNGQYPPQNGQYPPQNGQYPPQGGQYPPQNGQYPQTGQYPPQNGQYGQYPPQNGQYPPQGGQYPPQNGQYPPQSGPYPNYQQEPLVDGPCTFNRTHKSSMRQPFYQCVTCGLVNGLGCCEACARVCHAGHQLIPQGYRDCYCDCGEGSCRTCVRCRCLRVTASQAQQYQQYSSHPETAQCSYCRTGQRMTNQNFYTCVTCRLQPGMCICEACARICHAGHDVRPLGNTQGFCDCGAGNLQQRCRCMNKMQPGRPGMNNMQGPPDCNLQ